MRYRWSPCLACLAIGLHAPAAIAEPFFQYPDGAEIFIEKITAWKRAGRVGKIMDTTYHHQGRVVPSRWVITCHPAKHASASMKEGNTNVPIDVARQANRNDHTEVIYAMWEIACVYD